jgi:hypothetical protein
MFKTNNSLHVFVGPNSASADAAFQNDVTASAATGSGSIFVVDETGAAHSNAIAAGEFFKIGQKNADGTVNFSPLLEFDKSTFRGKATVARTQQSTTFGFNGTSGSVQAINSNRYTLRVNFTNNTDLYSEQSDLHFFEVVSDASATQQEIVDALVQNMSKSEKFSGKTAGKKRASVKVERLNDATSGATDFGTGVDPTFTNGSKIVTCADVDDATTNAAIAVGEYVTVSAAAGVADTDAIYKIVSIDTTNNFFELDQPFQGASGLVADNKVSRIAAATVQAGAAGIKITGLAQEFKLGLLTDTVVTFEVTLDGFGSTTAVSTTAAVKGSGVGNEVAELEWFGKGSQGAPYRHGVPNNTSDITLYAATSAAYDVMEIDATIADPGYAVAGAGTGKCQVILALVDNTNATDGAQANATFGLTSIFHA